MKYKEESLQDWFDRMVDERHNYRTCAELFGLKSDGFRKMVERCKHGSDIRVYSHGGQPAGIVSVKYQMNDGYIEPELKGS